MGPRELVLTVICIMILIFILIEIKVKHESEKQLKEQARQLERFMGYVCKSNELVLEVDLQRMVCRRFYLEDGRIRNVQEPYEFHDAINYRQTVHPGDHEKILQVLTMESIEAMINGDGGEQYFECRARKNDKEDYQWYAYTLQAIPKDETHPKNFILFKKNINESKEEERRQKEILVDALETARHASEAKGNFLSSMSHEIRTPLNAVIGYLSIAEAAGDDLEKIKHCIENGEIAARHLLNIINDVLDISSIESGKMKIAEEDFNLKELLSSLTAIFYNQAKEKGIDLKVSVKDLTEEWVVGDQLRVNQILMNLLSNAVKFTPEGGTVDMEVTQMSLEERIVNVKFVIADSGIGMSTEYMERMFEPFEQENAGTARKFGGSGLGLSISNNLVNMMGGAIRAESIQGEGSRFTVSLHFGISEKNGEIIEKVPEFSHIRVLIIADEAAEGDRISQLFRRCGVKSDIVGNGGDALRQLKRRSGTDYAYDLCLIDWNMQKQSGLELVQAIRLEFPDKPAIIIVTGNNSLELQEKAKKAGADRIIEKPLFQSTMMDLLVCCYGKYQTVPENIKDLDLLRGVRILLAEDNQMNLEIEEDILKKAGVQLTTAVNGKEALDCFLKSEPGQFELILMDVQMPVMDGYEATRQIRRSSHPQAEKIPIIAMTANAFHEDVSEALACGMNDHVSKPVDYKKLFALIQKFVRQNAGE